MSVVLASASSQYVYEVITGWAVKPVTLSAWIYTNDAANNQGIVGLTDNNDEFLLLQARMAIAGDPLGALEYDTAWKVATSGTSISTATWHHVMGVFKSSTSRIVYLDGVDKVENTDLQDVHVEDLTRILIGTHKQAGGAYFEGNIAEVAIWQAELTDANAVSLAAGANPSFINPDNLSKYWRLLSDGTSAIGGNTLIAANGATYDSEVQPSIGNVFTYPTSNIETIKRIVVAGNDEIWYEDI